MTEKAAIAGIILVAATWMAGSPADIKVGMVVATCLCVAGAMIWDLIKKRRRMS